MIICSSASPLTLSCQSQVSWRDYVYSLIVPCFSLKKLFHVFHFLRHRKMTTGAIAPIARLWWIPPVTYFLPKVPFQFFSYLDSFLPFILFSNPSMDMELLLKFILFGTDLFCVYLSYHFFLSLFPQSFSNISLLFASPWCGQGLSPWIFPLFILNPSWVVSFTHTEYQYLLNSHL